MQAVLVSTLSLAGKKVLLEVIQEIYAKMKEAKHPKVQSLLTHLDLQSDLKVIQSLVEEIAIKELEEDQHDVVDVALGQVQEMMVLIKNELIKIQSAVSVHESKFFAQYREPNFQINMSQLIENKIILDKRVELLIKLIMMKELHSLASSISDSKNSTTGSRDLVLNTSSMSVTSSTTEVDDEVSG